MEITNVSAQRPPLKKLPKAPATMPEHQPGVVRDVVEKLGGALGAVKRIPASLLAGVAIGGYHGARKGADEHHTINPKNVALGVAAINTLEDVARSALVGGILLGPAGAIANATKDAAGSGLKLYLFVKGGSAAEIGKQMTSAIDAGVEAGEGAVEGALHGAFAGTKSAVKSGVQTGYQEGRAGFSGIIEGLEEIPREFSHAKGLDGSLWRRALSVASGVVSAAFAAPVGLALSVLKGADGAKTVSKPARVGVAAASGAVVGAAAGALLGPLGILVGAGVGAVVGLLGPGAKKGFEAQLGSSLARSKSDDGDMGSEIGNRRRDLTQKVITGALSGARQGWDAGAGQWHPA